MSLIYMARFIYYTLLGGLKSVKMSSQRSFQRPSFLQYLMKCNYPNQVVVSWSGNVCPSVGWVTVGGTAVDLSEVQEMTERRAVMTGSGGSVQTMQNPGVTGGQSQGGRSLFPGTRDQRSALWVLQSETVSLRVRESLRCLCVSLLKVASKIQLKNWNGRRVEN